MEKNTWKNNRGITLIALIITVLILTILTVVSIGVILSQDYFNKASDTVGQASSKVEQQKEQEENLKETWDDVPGRVVKSKTNATTTIELTARVENITRTSFRIRVEGTNKDNEDLTFSLQIADRTYTYEEKVGKEVYWDVGISPDTALTPNTVYLFEIIGRDSKSENNVVGEVTTLANNAPVIENVTINPLTETTATINVTATDEENDDIVYVLEMLGDTKTSNTGIFDVTGLTQNTTYSYKVKVIDTFSAYDEYQNTFKTLKSNKTPVITKNSDYKSGKTTTKFTIEMSATDADGDNLTYTLYASTAQNGTYYQVGTATGTSGASKTIPVTAINGTALTQYTIYWWYITVSDGTVSVTSDKQSVRTYCPGPTTVTCKSGYFCDDNSTEQVDCDYCEDGSNPNCDGEVRSYVGGQTEWIDCPCGMSIYAQETYVCECEAMVIGDQCDWCGRRIYNKIMVHNCRNCRGAGFQWAFIRCEHGSNSGHYYCDVHELELNNTTTHTVTTNCGHAGATGQHE